MLFAHRCQIAIAVLLLCSLNFGDAVTTVLKPTLSLPEHHTATCEARAINYITDSLPQLCLKASWANIINASYSTAQSASDILPNKQSVPTSLTTRREGVQSATNPESQTTELSFVSADSTLASPNPYTSTEEESGKETDGELSNASFLSFEDWKKQELEKAGQQNSNIGNRKSQENKRRDSESFQNNFESIGDEGEIDLDFSAFGASEDIPRSSEPQNLEYEADINFGGGSARRKDHYRSKDAGKTCKERFSYSSFDAGATVLKTHPGAKNAKAVLVENKDSYMLSECAAENKFIIVELSEDIWIDTLVLANYEFFSSMIRTFRVSVSDRYPVKHWHDLGILEARNSREIQAFLVENPLIWARYLRLEFLSHYGNEYYCPLSLVRVHGTRMIENWKEEERAEEEEEELRSQIEDTLGADSNTETVGNSNSELGEEETVPETFVKISGARVLDQTSTALNSINESHASELGSGEMQVTLWTNKMVDLFLMNTTTYPVCSPEADPGFTAKQMVAKMNQSTKPAVSVRSLNSVNRGASSTASTSNQSHSSTALISANSQAGATAGEISSTTKSGSSTGDPGSPTQVSNSWSNKAENAATSQKQKGTGTSSASTSLPTIQESFFKAVSRRLQLLEANSTLSLKYIEEQSKMLREAFSKVEKKQLQKTSTFLDNLNSTVFSELRGFRQQYDEIWQATIISLESQKAESQREILAITARLNILADELVFQKRMSIVQACLLLLCLGLVIFSRVSSTGQPYFPTHMRSRTFFRSPVESPPNSPEYYRVQSLRGERSWNGAGHRRNRSEESIGSPSGDDSPPTPVSPYSRSRDEPYAQNEYNDRSRDLIIDSHSQYESPYPSKSQEQERRGWEDGESPGLGAGEEHHVFPTSLQRGNNRPNVLSSMATPPLEMESQLSDDETCSTPEKNVSRQLVINETWLDQQSQQPHKSSNLSEDLFSIARKPLPALPSENHKNQ